MTGISWENSTLPETNIAPENDPLESRRFLLETIIFRCYVSFRECIFTYVYLWKSTSSCIGEYTVCPKWTLWVWMIFESEFFFSRFARKFSCVPPVFNRFFVGEQVFLKHHRLRGWTKNDIFFHLLPVCSVLWWAIMSSWDDHTLGILAHLLRMEHGT